MPLSAKKQQHLFVGFEFAGVGVGVGFGIGVGVGVVG